jgi:hypothetical protein
MRKKVKKISREDIERISTDEIVLKENQRFPENMEEIDHGEGALYSLKYISEHYSDGNLMVFRYHYKNADLKTRRYIRQCADMADLFELIGDIK